MLNSSAQEVHSSNEKYTKSIVSALLCTLICRKTLCDDGNKAGLVVHKF